jgi:very-short-patch-repair endonuclease
MGYYCSQCQDTISEKEFNYSKEHFSRALCRAHQINQSKKSYHNKPQATPEARRLGELLKKYGYHVEFEKYDGYKHIDIAIVKSKVNIEVDGNQHHSKEQALRDLKRTFYSWNKDYVTLRIPNSLTRDDTIEETAEYIDKFLKKNRIQLEKEIREEYVEEGNPIWEDVDNFINSASKLVSNVGNALSNAFKKI